METTDKRSKADLHKLWLAQGIATLTILVSFFFCRKVLNMEMKLTLGPFIVIQTCVEVIVYRFFDKAFAVCLFSAYCVAIVAFIAAVEPFTTPLILSLTICVFAFAFLGSKENGVSTGWALVLTVTQGAATFIPIKYLLHYYNGGD